MNAQEPIMSVCLITCDIFRHALTQLGFARGHPRLRLHYLPAYLHLQPAVLKERLLAEVARAETHCASMGCLYGHCFADIDAILEEKKIVRMPPRHCFEALIGPERYAELINQDPGRFFVERELLEHFETYCWQPLELDDPQVRHWYFEHYHQLVYIRQPSDPPLAPRARRIAADLGLAYQCYDADYGQLKRMLTRLYEQLKLIAHEKKSPS
jgi:hypothetical protein